VTEPPRPSLPPAVRPASRHTLQWAPHAPGSAGDSTGAPGQHAWSAPLQATSAESRQRGPWLAPRWDLGIRALVRRVRGASSRASLRDDALAGLTLVGPSFALALLIAQYAGLSTAAALMCAVVGSFAVALLGGSTHGLSGPGLAMGLVMADVTRAHGAAGLALACGITGAFQLGLGVLGIGRFARLVPLTAVHAFTFAMGTLLVILCLPQVLGVQTPMDLDVPHVIDHLVAHIGDTRWPSVLIAVLACAAMLAGARHAPRAPVALLVIAAAATVTGLAELSIPTLPDLPITLTPARLPDAPGHGVAQFVGAVLVLFALATIETVLSTIADEERSPGTRNDISQELIGHGLANGVLALLGGVPVVGSIVRATALRGAGSRTRVAALVHAVVGAGLLPLVLFAERFVPLAVLAGVAVALAVPLLDLRPLRAVAKVSTAELVVLVVTSFTIVFAGLLSGIEAALVATLALAMLQVARFRATLHHGTDGAPHQVNLSGPITFLSTPELDRIRSRLAAIDPSTGVILDVRSVLVMDLTGCMRFLGLVSELVEREARVVVLGASPSCRQKLEAADRRGLLAERMAVSDRDVDAVLGQAGAFEMRAHVIANLERFRLETREHYTPLFDQLADGQTPHTLFVTCVDSRVSPAMLTGAHPGELFILRCLGAIVAPPGGSAPHAEGAAVEYAIHVLGVRNIVICGHSQCGAVKAVKSGHVPEGLANLEKWLSLITPATGDLSYHHDVDEAARAVTVRQLANLRQFPAVREQLASGGLRLLAWFYDVGQAELFEWDEGAQRFAVLGGEQRGA
jgi:carbonic anhydrase